MLKKTPALIIIVAILTALMSPMNFSSTVAKADVPEPDVNQIENISDIISYHEYLGNYADAVTDLTSVRIKAQDYTSATAEVEKRTGLGKESKPGLYMGDEGIVQWTVDIPESGLYQIGLSYFPVEGKRSAMERMLYIDGEIPFSEAASLSVPRTWENEGEAIVQDDRENDIYPKQIEVYRWSEEYYRDAMGYYDEPLLFYLEAGQHTIALESVKEPIIIGEILFTAREELPTYDEALAFYKSQGLKEVNLSEHIKIQAELADFKSSPVLSPVYDRSSPLLEPYDGAKQRLNILGGGRFSGANMWTEYIVEVAEEGLYQMVFKTKQTEARGLMISRRMYINGELPFKEANQLEFEYTSGYVNKVFGDDTPYLIHLEKGENVIKIESTLGVLAGLSRDVTEIMLTLNDAYRRLVVVTGTNPDRYRDYMIEQKLPDVIETFNTESIRLREIAKRLEDVAGENSSHTAILETVALQLENLYKRPTRIPREINNLNANMSSLGTWVNNIKQTNLDMDYILITSEGLELPKAEASFLQKLVHEIQMFFTSFVEDYDTIGNIADGDRSISVWINSGRDQAQVLKNMIDSDFTPESGIQVDMKLVQGALLQATVAGIGPDVALTVGGGDPINFAIRGAVHDLSTFGDFDEVIKRFPESAMVPLHLEGGHYGLPEKAFFPMLFYRKDILDELDIEVPKTWDQVYELIPILQRNNMNFGLPVSNIAGGTNDGIASFGSILYQMGGSFYNEEGSRAVFDSEEAIASMKMWSDYYNSYGLPISFDFINRFSTGEMPIAVVDYTNYNTLTVFAPQIRNLWGITSIPGIMQGDGTISHAAPIGIDACMIMDNTTQQEKNDSWEFLKWWTGADVQTEFAYELETLMGEAGRYPAANLEAMMNIAWPTQDLRQLEMQFDQVFGIPEVPGGYYTWRHLDNAFREIINNNIDAREVMVDYNITINREIEHKRKEFGLE